MTHICVNKLTVIGSPGRRHWFAWTAPSHYLNQCWIIVDWTLGNKLQWNHNRNSNIFIQENAFESVVCETASILSRPQCGWTGRATISHFVLSFRRWNIVILCACVPKRPLNFKFLTNFNMIDQKSHLQNSPTIFTLSLQSYSWCSLATYFTNYHQGFIEANCNSLYVNWKT